VTARLGAANRDIGSGIFDAYRLSDGSDVLIRSADRSDILYVRHGQDIFSEKMKPTPVTPRSYRFGFPVVGSYRRRGSALGR
jgi:hypothetical protein